jgi:hypothetical protein
MRRTAAENRPLWNGHRGAWILLKDSKNGLRAERLDDRLGPIPEDFALLVRVQPVRGVRLNGRHPERSRGRVPPHTHPPAAPVRKAAKSVEPLAAPKPRRRYPGPGARASMEELESRGVREYCSLCDQAVPAGQLPGHLAGIHGPSDGGERK